MKKKLLLLMLLIIPLIFSTGCEANEKERNELLDALKRDKIVSRKLENIDYIVDVNAGIIPSRTTYYVYKDTDNSLIAISYESDYSSENDYNYLVTIYHNVTENKNYETITNDEAYSTENYYIYEDGTKSIEEKYNLEDIKVYEVTKKTSFIFSKLKIKERSN